MDVVLWLWGGTTTLVLLVAAVLNREELRTVLGFPPRPPESPVAPWSPPPHLPRLVAAPARTHTVTAPCALGDPRPVLRLGRRAGSLTAEPNEVAAPFADERFLLLATAPDHPLHAAVVEGLRASLPGLLRLLPANGRRWLVLRGRELVLVRTGQPLSDESERGLQLELCRVVRAIDEACGDRPSARPRVVEARAAVRCAFCHDGLGDDGRSCLRCGTRVHAACHEELAARCPTPGCAPRRAAVHAA